MNIQIKIGTTNVVRGQVTATGADGNVRLLQPHTPIFQDDVIQTSTGNAAIAFTDGSHMFLGRNSDIQLDPSVYDPSEFHTETPPSQEETADEDKTASGINAIGNLMFCTGNSEMRLTDIAGMPIGKEGDTTIKGQYGSLYIAADSGFRYTVDANNSDVSALGNGDSLTDSFNYNIQRTADLCNAATLEITILGTEEDPIIGSVSTYSQRIHSASANESAKLSNDSTSGAVAFIPDSETQQLLDTIDDAAPDASSESEPADELVQIEEPQQQLETSEPEEAVESADEPQTEQPDNEPASVVESTQSEATDDAQSAKTASEQQEEEQELVVVVETETMQQSASEDQPPVATTEATTEPAPIEMADDAASPKVESNQNEEHEQVVVIEPAPQAVTSVQSSDTATAAGPEPVPAEVTSEAHSSVAEEEQVVVIEPDPAQQTVSTDETSAVKNESSIEPVAATDSSETKREQPEDQEQVVVIEPETQEQFASIETKEPDPEEPITPKQPEQITPTTTAINPAAASSSTSNDNSGMGAATSPLTVYQPAAAATETHEPDTSTIISSIDKMKRLPMESGDSLILSLQDASEITNDNSGLIITGNATNEISIAAHEWEEHEGITIEGLNYTLFKGQNDETLLIDQAVTVNKESFS